MSVVNPIRKLAANAINSIYNIDVADIGIAINETKPEFEGDYTIVLFNLIRQLKTSPEQAGKDIGEYLVQNHPDLFTAFNVIKGFLNLSISDKYFLHFLADNFSNQAIAKQPATGRRIMLEYSSPNTNKPLHLGHLRNNFLGWSVAEILKHAGNEVMKTCVVNDRGIHICKSMIAWQLFGNGDTPQSTGIKGDHLVGEYYVKCENQIKQEAEELSKETLDGDYSNIEEKDRQRLTELQELMNAVIGDNERDKEKLKKMGEERKEIIRANTPIMKKAQAMLVDWEAGKPEVIDLWKKMNGWVYEGFDETYKRIGSDFDKVYYESQTYIVGRKFVEAGLEKGVFFKKDDGSIWIDLEDEGLDEKLVLRKDGTSVYITQDLGLADQKYKEFKYDESWYVIADEQNYHMKVLQLILKKLGMPYADAIRHLSYGMVDLPSGRMKSREGTVVDADDLVDEMMNVAAHHTKESGKVQDFNEAELQELYETIGLGALKFYLLRVDPKKRMVFNPEESIDFHGFTGPFIQYTHARIKSILRKANLGEPLQSTVTEQPGSLEKLEKELLLLLEQYPSVVSNAAAEHNPSTIAVYAFNIAQKFNSFYSEHSVLNAESEEKKQLRLQLSNLTANIIKNAMHLLGIKVPDRM